MRKLFLTTLFGFGLGIVPGQAAEIVVKLRPPISIQRASYREAKRAACLGRGLSQWDGRCICLGAGTI